MAGKPRNGAENSFISVLIPLSAQSLSSPRPQGWSCKPNVTAQFLSNSVKFFVAAVRANGGRNSLTPRSGDDFFNTATRHYLISSTSAQQK